MRAGTYFCQCFGQPWDHYLEVLLIGWIFSIIKNKVSLWNSLKFQGPGNHVNYDLLLSDIFKVLI